MEPSKKLHVALLSSPGLGHLIPILVLGNRLATLHDAKVTVLVIGASASPAEDTLLKHPGENHDMNIIEIPQVDISHLLESNTKIVEQLCIMVRAALPGVRSAIAAMNHRPDVFIGDLFCPPVFPIAAEFGIPKYVYVPSTAWFAAFMAYSHVLDREIIGQYIDQVEPLKIPGCKLVRPEDVVDPMLDRNDRQYREYLDLGIGFAESDGILLNTWEVLEPVSLKSLRENEALVEVVKVPVFPIGPLTRSSKPDQLDGDLKEWLDMQPNESVLFVSFGSGGSLPFDQLCELACGLELSEQRFIWVVRPPAKGRSDESFFNSGNGEDNILDFLPEGFLDRTKDIGLVIPIWAPQVEILSHPSVGGFLSHCGWNSTLESITNGVPMIAWPLYSEQRLNATMLTEELGVAVRPEVLPTKKVVGREEIEKMIRTIMQYEEGKPIRERVKQLKISGAEALKNEGSSSKSLHKVLQDADMRLKKSKEVEVADA